MLKGPPQLRKHPVYSKYFEKINRIYFNLERIHIKSPVELWYQIEKQRLCKFINDRFLIKTCKVKSTYLIRIAIKFVPTEIRNYPQLSGFCAVKF
jgi:hypothetical protein